ncbi:MAG: FAD-dependent oxidoreductase, partial [Acidobacteria bacterium]|nr:FAD-dependent oxidoreductase [Acidobacteriota bacterium]
TGPKGQTVLCAELPCAADRGTDESELREVVLGALGRAGIPVRCGVRRVVVRRLAQAYPVYLKGFREDLIRVKDWVDGIEGVVSLGRQGLFAHDNTHHTVAMAYAAEGCVGAGGVFDRERWAGHLRRFEGFVVED